MAENVEDVELDENAPEQKAPNNDQRHRGGCTYRQCLCDIIFFSICISTYVLIYMYVTSYIGLIPIYKNHLAQADCVVDVNTIIYPCSQCSSDECTFWMCVQERQIWSHVLNGTTYNSTFDNWNFSDLKSGTHITCWYFTNDLSHEVRFDDHLYQFRYWYGWYVFCNLILAYVAQLLMACFFGRFGVGGCAYTLYRKYKQRQNNFAYSEQKDEWV